MKKTIAMFLTLAIIFAMVPTSVAHAAWDFNLNGYFFTKALGSEDTVYITVKDDVPLRTKPSRDGDIMKRLATNYPVKAEGLYDVSYKGTMSRWIKIWDEECSVNSWIYIDNLSKHTCSYLCLQDYGVEFCSLCGHIRPLQVDCNISTMDSVHLVLAAAGMVPFIGNGADLIDGMLSLYEGDYAGALLNLALAVPLIGSLGGNAVKIGDRAQEVLKVGDTVVTASRVTDKLVLVDAVASSTKLAKNMDAKYLESFLDRFYNYKEYILPDRTIAAHHIVAGSASNEAATKSRALLAYAGVGINDAENGVYLVMREQFNGAGGAIHNSRHSDAYYETVYNRLTSAINGVGDRNAMREAVVAELDKIANDLMYGRLSLN